MTINGNRIKLGYFINKKDAIVARLKKEKEILEEYSPQSELFEKYGIIKEVV